jgi:hypothetical protein
MHHEKKRAEQHSQDIKPRKINAGELVNLQNGSSKSVLQN